MVKANSFCQSSSGSVYSQSKGFRLTNEVTAVGLPISAVQAFDGIGKIARFDLTKLQLKQVKLFYILRSQKGNKISASSLVF